MWLYAHRLTRDTFFQLQNDVVAPKVAHEERRLSDLMRDAGDNPSAGQRKEIAAQAVFVDELRQLLDEVKRVAPLWNPMLDDGVVLAMAPLWRRTRTPQHKAWQRELKNKWDDLAAAKYQWAQIAMHFSGLSAWFRSVQRTGVSRLLIGSRTCSGFWGPTIRRVDAALNSVTWSQKGARARADRARREGGTKGLASTHPWRKANRARVGSRGGASV